MKAWQLQEAKARFSEVVNAALSEGPQSVTKHGEEVVVIMSQQAYLELTQAHTSLDDALAGAPEELTVSRDATPVPAITFE
jgi:antitoxin Phd